MAETPVQRAIRARLMRSPAISKRALAAQIGVKPDRLIAWERGTPPREYQLVRMAPHLDVSVDELAEEAEAGVANPLPDDIADALRKLIELADLVPAMKQVSEKAPDLIKALEDVRDGAKQFKL